MRAVEQRFHRYRTLPEIKQDMNSITIQKRIQHQKQPAQQNRTAQKAQCFLYTRRPAGKRHHPDQNHSGVEQAIKKKQRSKHFTIIQKRDHWMLCLKT